MAIIEKNFWSNRINEICKTRKSTCKELAEECGIPYSTFQRYSSGKVDPRAEVFLALYEKIGINLDWFIEGEGEMYRADRPDQVRQEVAANYARDSNVVTQNGVHNNTHIVAKARPQGSGSGETGGRESRLCQFVGWWMQNHGPDDQAWLEKQVERAVPEYAAWKKGQGG